MAKEVREENRRFSYGKKADLDERDWEIMHLVAEDARMPASRIARKLGCSREVVKYRLNKLVREGVVQFITWTNPPKLGYTVWGYMHISFKDMTPVREKEFIAFVKNHPYVSFAHSSLGTYDFGIEFFAHDLGHFYNMQKELKEKFADIIKDYESGSFIDVYKVLYVPRTP